MSILCLKKPNPTRDEVRLFIVYNRDIIMHLPFLKETKSRSLLPPPNGACFLFYLAAIISQHFYYVCFKLLKELHSLRS